jgi:hypothetical protein
LATKDGRLLDLFQFTGQPARLRSQPESMQTAPCQGVWLGAMGRGPAAAMRKTSRLSS